MSVWTLLQIVFNLVMGLGVVLLFFRLRRPPQDDPRMSRGLQLLQTKITVLEDLSDRTDTQVKQLTALLDQKTRMLQNKVIEAEQQILKIDHSMHKSMEVAEIFQDKIPHQEILERQRTVEYVRAARMAHSGLSVDEIAKTVPLPREQIELIAKFNRDQLMFDESQLPQWADKPSAREDDMSFSMAEMDFVGGLGRPNPDLDQMAQLEGQFKKAVEDARVADAAANDLNFSAVTGPIANAAAIVANQTAILESRVSETLRTTAAQPAVMSLKATAQTLRDRIVSTAEDMLRPTVGGPSAERPHIVSESKVIRAETPKVRKVIFPKIDK